MEFRMVWKTWDLLFGCCYIANADIGWDVPGLESAHWLWLYESRWLHWTYELGSSRSFTAHSTFILQADIAPTWIAVRVTNLQFPDSKEVIQLELWDVFDRLQVFACSSWACGLRVGLLYLQHTSRYNCSSLQQLTETYKHRKTVTRKLRAIY